MRARARLVLAAAVAAAAAAAAVSCGGGEPETPDPSDEATGSETAAGGGDGAEAPGEDEIEPPVKPAEAPDPTERVEDGPAAGELAGRIESYFDANEGRRVHIQIDKPLYRPGETIWLKTWDLSARALGDDHENTAVHYELVSPKGDVMLRKRVREQGGHASNDFRIPDGAAGGQYKIRARTSDGHTVERPVVVSSYEPPRIKKKLEFVRKAYGEGDEVVATVKLERGTDQPLGNHELTGLVRLDGQQLERVKTETNAAGGAVVRFELPDDIERGDGMLTVLVEDAGVTESITRRIPIVLDALEVSFFPEGGQLVEGLPGRVYFEAKKPAGKPADVEGRIVDDQNNTVARFSSYKNGLGRVAFTPNTGRRYHAEITKPARIDEDFQLPLPEEEGCTLRHYDDPDGQLVAIRVGVRCSEAREVAVSAFLRDNPIDVAQVEVPEGDPAVVYLEPEDESLARAQGVARVTVFSTDLEPLAERLVFRGRRHRLDIEVEPDSTDYEPRDKVVLNVTTKDPSGEAVPARVAMSVVDDKVVSYADDKTAHLLAGLLLEPELPGDIEEPNFFLDLTEEKSARALDLLMGTRGYRKFTWRRVLEPPPASTTAAATGADRGDGDDFAGPGRRRQRQRALELRQGVEGRRAAPRDGRQRPDRVVIQRNEIRIEDRAAAPEGEAEEADGPPPPAAQPAPAEVAAAEEAEPMPAADMDMEAPAMEPPAQMDELADGERMRRGRGVRGGGGAGVAVPMDARRANARKGRMGWAKVREFPVPDYAGEHEGPRNDFRETVYWGPDVETDEDGKAKVELYLSDAITSFRVFSEGVGGGVAGRDETVFRSSLPFGMTAKLPLEVSAGDALELPVTLMNERNEPMEVALTASFGELLTPADGTELEQSITLDAGERSSRYFVVNVTGKRGESEVRFEAEAGGLTDELERQVKVAPRGFPQEIVHSGELGGSPAQLEVDLGKALAGTVVGSVKVYPSPVATMTSGMEGMLREPHGCFEQASSSNYPNVMLMRYLEEQDVAAPDVAERAKGMLERGYRKLVGYESKEDGYEWFGSNPAHEALTAYGLLEFVDMQRVWGDVDHRMIDRTAKWLLGRRDGDGGFERNDRALDSFGRASEEVTNAYIIYSLAEAGYGDELGDELDAQAELANEADDSYVLALAANSLLRAGRRGPGRQAVRRLAAMQGDGGAWTEADHSITRSTGNNLALETTSLAVLALLEAGGHRGDVRKAVSWLNEQRGGFGGYGATQATVLTLRALTEYANKSRKMQSDGTLKAVVADGEPLTSDYAAGRNEPVEIDIGELLDGGRSKVRVERARGSGPPLPYTLHVRFRSEKPATSPEAAISVSTELSEDEVAMGESVRLTAKVRNVTDAGVGMTLARVGLPGGLSFQDWQLKELQEQDEIAFYETREREVILYFRDMGPGESKTIPIELTASVPGRYVGPASRAYLYYTNEHKHWTDPLSVTVTR